MNQNPLLKLVMTYLSRWIFILGFACSSCAIGGLAGIETFGIGAAGNIAGDYIYNNVDLKEPGPVNVKIVKLISGEELIGEFDEVKYTIDNPVVMIPVNNEKIAFSPWMPYADDKTFTLKEDQVLVIATPSKTIANEYSKAFGSGILVP